jgi:uncharacterized protein (DUF2249 family)
VGLEDKNRIILQGIKKYYYLLGNIKVLKKYIFEPPTIISDHSPINYLRNLNNNVEKF